MNVFAQVMAVLVGSTLVVVGILESFFYRRPELYPIFLIRPEDVPAVRLWTVNQGFYNLCFGVAAIGGVVTLHLGDPTVGRTLVLFACASMVVLGAVLFFSERRLWLSALGQSLPSLAVLVAAPL
jgi:putative membrane protein